jgi:hypothetical protein
MELNKELQVFGRCLNRSKKAGRLLRYSVREFFAPAAIECLRLTGWRKAVP